MRSLAQPAVLARAATAAAATTIASYPQLALWMDRPRPVQDLLFVLLWTTFVLWGFVFAWQQQYAGKPVFPNEWKPKLWAWATFYGLVAAVFLRFCVDPGYRLAAPENYPANMKSWVAMTLFALAFDPLFYCFAPFAFFSRLVRRQHVAASLTVIFGVFVVFLKLHQAPARPPVWVMAELIAGTAIAGFMSIYFYLQGGVLLVLWPMLLTQLRHLGTLI